MTIDTSTSIIIMQLQDRITALEQRIAHMEQYLAQATKVAK